MNKIVITTVAAITLAVASVAYAGGACCASKKSDAASAKADRNDACGSCLSKLNLTDEQKTKIEALKQECKQTKCSEASHAKFMEGLKGVLTADQLAQCKVDCEKVAKQN